MEEIIALFGEFGTSVLQPGAVISLAITVVLFILRCGGPAPIRPAAASREGEGSGACGDCQAGQVLG